MSAVHIREPFAPIDFRTRFPALDGIRALAITMVFANHYGGGATHGGHLLHLVNAIRLRGQQGVDLFFVLSGFLITGILFDTQNDSRFFYRFFGRRAVRIFPVVYLLFAVLAILTPVFGYHWRWLQATFPVYLGNFFGNADFSLYSLTSATHPNADVILGHMWSLCVEEQFYMLWPLAIWVLRDRVKLLWAAAGLSVLSLGFRVAMVLVVSPSTAETWIIRTLPFRLDSLLAGALLALALRGPGADRVQQSMKWLFVGGLVPLLLIFWLSPDVRSPWMLTVGLSFAALTSVGLIGMTLRPQSRAFRLFHLRPARALGKYSYGFYVWHVVWADASIALLVYLSHRLHSFTLAGLIELRRSFW